MARNWPSGFGVPFGGGDDRRDSVIRDRLDGLATVLMGVSLLPIAFVFADSTRSAVPFVVVIVGSMELTGFGIDVFRGTGTFETEWGEREWLGWSRTVLRAIYAVGMVVGSVWVVA